MEIGLYSLIFDGMVIAFGSVALLISILSICNFLIYDSLLNYNTVQAGLLAVLPLIFGTIVGSFSIYWGLGIIIIVEAIILARAFEQMFA